MKDLYRRLELPSLEHDVIAIREAISKCKEEELAAAASHILLNARRKSIYDRNWRVMRKVSQLRANLGLTDGASWQHIAPDDFAPTGARPSSELGNLRRELRAMQDHDDASHLQV